MSRARARFAWMDEALCAQIGADAFFPEQRDNTDARRARTVCTRCPVRAQCLEWALSMEPLDPHLSAGTYGGVSVKARSRMDRST